MFSKICAIRSITLTPLRQDILDIMHAATSPLGAYDILEALKNKRQNAQPATVYRVLDFLIEKHLVHRIESQNTYVACSHMLESAEFHLAILLFCEKCHHSFECEDRKVLKSLEHLADHYAFSVSSSVIEIQGTCKKCLGVKKN